MTDFNAAAPKENQFICYLNGIEVPFLAANVRYGVWEIPTFDITFAYGKELVQIGKDDRLEAAIFYPDYHSFPKANSAKVDFRLLFDGEVLGWSFTNYKNRRAITLFGMCCPQILSRLYLNYVTDITTLTGSVLNHAAAQDVPIFTSDLLYPYALFLKNADITQPQIKRPYEFLINIFRTISDINVQGKHPSRIAIDFYHRMFLKTNIFNRAVACPVFDSVRDNSARENESGIFPLLNSIQQTAALGAVSALAKETESLVGNRGTAFESLKAILLKMNYELGMLPTAPAVMTNVDGEILGAPTEDDLALTGEFSFKRALRLAQLTTKPQAFYGLPPVCNVLFPSMYDGYRFEENYDAQPTRTFIGHNQSYYMNGNNFQNGDPFMDLPRGYPAEVLGAVKDGITQPNVNHFAARLIYPAEYFKGPRSNTLGIPQWLHLLVSEYAKDGSTSKEDKDKLFNLYVEYEHKRLLYSDNTGAITSGFNPYPVPGYSGFIFDQNDPGLHIFTYFTGVSHSITDSGASTTIQYGFAQPIEDFFTNILSANKDKSLHSLVQIPTGAQSLAAAPELIVPEIRDTLQTVEGASSYFRALLFRNNLEENSGVTRPVVADIATLLEYFDKNGVATPIDFEVDIEVGARDTRAKRTMAQVFAQHDDAMSYVARPICTLKEYVSFRNRAPLPTGNAAAKIISGDFDNWAGKPAEYYVQILNLKPPSVNPPQQPPPDDEVAGLNFPMTKEDWAAKLYRYRDRIYTGTVPLNG